MENFDIFCPLPPAGINPNQARKHHWRKLAELIRNYRFEGWAACRAKNLPQLMAEKATITMSFNFHDKRRRDVANFAASTKPLIDGLVDYKLLKDDDQITWMPPTMTVDRTRDAGVYLRVSV